MLLDRCYEVLSARTLRIMDKNFRYNEVKHLILLENELSVCRNESVPFIASEHPLYSEYIFVIESRHSITVTTLNITEYVSAIQKSTHSITITNLITTFVVCLQYYAKSLSVSYMTKAFINFLHSSLLFLYSTFL